jgi:hypothetical protein
MRRIVYSSLLALAVVAAPLATADAQLTAGGFVGINSSNISVSNLAAGQSLKSRTGTMVGGWLGFKLIPLFTAQLEAYYTKKGADFEESGQPTTAIKIDYLEIPLLLKLNIPLVVVHPSIYAGVAYSFMASCNAEVSGAPAVDCNDPGPDLGIKDSDFSGIVGVAVKFGLFKVALQYDQSFNSILDDPNTTAKNKTWTLLGGIGI